MKIPQIDTLLMGNRYISIELYSCNNINKIALVEVTKKKEGLLIEKKDKVHYKGEIAEKWDKSLPYFLVLNTNQVLQKEVLYMDPSDEKLVNKAFPNTNWETFYYEIWRLKSKTIVAITRKNYLDELIQKFKNQQIGITGISIGTCAIADLRKYSTYDELRTNHQIITNNEQETIMSASAEELPSVSFDINNLAIPNAQLLAFSGTIRLVSNFTSNSGSIITLSSLKKEEYLQQRFFSKGSKIILGVLLALLLINFLSFSHYFKADQEASEKIAIHQVDLQNLASIKQRVKNKESIVQNVFEKKGSQSSFYCNDIAQMVPPSILLSELEFNPLEKKVKNEESVRYIDRTILISGISKDNTAFTNWIEAIEKKYWTSKVVIIHFGKNDNNETEFSVKINLK
ncbi:hypothetical protein ACNQGB_02160 [Flavobacterium sp. XS1P32]|uniref:hypothetical protein n=1 Tax=Flavobacterium sp. XS1P32 TaxID=3401726 RepID=UPI003AAD8125